MELVDTTLASIFANKYASSAITLFLVLYGGLAAPKLPKFMVKLFENPIFKIVILSLIVYNGNRDPKFAIMIGVAFTVTLNMISNQKFLEGFEDNQEDFTDIDSAEYSDSSYNDVYENMSDDDDNQPSCPDGLFWDSNEGECVTKSQLIDNQNAYT
tara:strand:+ start:308 stop:775 length:468 start_codon:yes stop_codon:yes gene_type:complete